MTETTPGMFQRALDRVAGFIRPDQARDRHIEEMDQKIRQAEEKERAAWAEKAEADLRKADRASSELNDVRPATVYEGRWQVEGYGQTEIREVVVKTEAGFHPGIETSHMGGDGRITHSQQAFDNPAKALELAWAYKDGGEKELAIATRTYEDAAARITDLAQRDHLSLGQQVELQSSLTELGIGINNIRRENTAALEGWSQDPDARATLAETVERHRDQMHSTGRLLREASYANVDIHDRAALDSYVSDTYGSEEAYLRRDRVLTTIQNMASGYKEGQLPAFQSSEAAQAFRADVEETWGEGSFDRLRLGNTDVLIPEMPSQGRRFMAVSALQVAWSREKRNGESRTAVLDHNEGIRLQSRVKSADWYSGYSDDSTVRQSGSAEVSSLNKDLSEYAARSPSHAAWISRSFDEHGPADVRKFTGYVKETDRDAVGAFPESHTSPRANLTANEANKNHHNERDLD